jgi:AraC-like DNA-binding protein
LPPSEAKKLRAKLDAIFITQRPHLNPDLGLSDLAQMVDIPRNQLSFVINNSEQGVNFYDLVNGWRVKEFRSLAADPRRDDDKILTLALDAGFNSKPTFNKVVLKLTGKTPTQVRQDEIASRRSR